MATTPRLFGTGLGEEELAAQLLDKKATDFAKMSQGDRLASMGYTAGNRLGTSLAGAFGVDVREPAMKRASMLAQMAQQFDTTSPAGLRQLAQAMKNVDPDMSLKVAEQANLLELNGEKILTERATQKQKNRESTPANIQTAQRVAELKGALSQLEAMPSSPEVDSLKRKLKDELTAYSLSENKLTDVGRQITEAFGFEPGTPQFQAKMQEYLTATIKGKEKGSGNVTIGSIGMPGTPIDPKKAAEEAGKLLGKGVGEVENKYSALDSLSEAQNILNKGIFAGFYGDAAMTAAKATSRNNPKVVNTEEFISYIGNTVVPRLKEFGGNDSNEELKYLQKIMGGDLRMEPKALENVLKSADKKIKLGIERLQRQSSASATGKPAPLDAGPTRDAAAGSWAIRQK